MKLTAAIILTVLSIAFVIIMLTKSVHFQQNCGGYLERAANANTIEMAENELSIALKYIEKEELTNGYTSVLWKTPDEDLGFWYSNIKTAYAELMSLPQQSSSLEKSNMLIKLRETLIDHGDKGDTLTVPQGISRYPQNGLFGSIAWLLTISTLIAWVTVTIEY
jgi:hypothetical protein